MLEQIRLIMQALPWAAPSVLIGLALGLVSMLLLPRRRTFSDKVGFALTLWGLTVAVVVTLSPVRNNYYGVPTLGCDWSVWRPLSPSYWFSGGSRPLNVWLLAPAGVGVMLLDRAWRKLLGAAMLGAFPLAIEAIQDFEPALKRSCSSQDVVDNWTGLLIGLLVGALLAMLIGIVRFIRRRAARRRGIVAPAEPIAPAEPSGRAAASEGSPAHEELGRPSLSGRGEPEHYDDFSDFDDSPRSTVYHERRFEHDDTIIADRSDLQRAHREDADATAPVGHVADVGTEAEATQAINTADTDATQVMPVKRPKHLR